jgi:hypothetical protein
MGNGQELLQAKFLIQKGYHLPGAEIQPLGRSSPLQARRVTSQPPQEVEAGES